MVLELISVLVSTVKVKIAVQDQDQKREIEKKLIEQSIPMAQVSFYLIPHDDIWFRDMGPIFLCNDNGEMIVEKFAFNCWGWDWKPGLPGSMKKKDEKAVEILQ